MRFLQRILRRLLTAIVLSGTCIIFVIIIVARRGSQVELVPAHESKSIVVASADNKQLSSTEFDYDLFNVTERSKGPRKVQPFKYDKIIEPNKDVLKSKYFYDLERILTRFEFDDVMLPLDKCGNNTLFVVMVMTTHSNQVKRDAIRKTWGSVTKGHTWPGSNLTINAKVIFAFGVSPKGSKSSLKMENFIHGDVYQGKFVDSYENLTIKVLMSLRFVSKYCPSAKYVLKADDDSFTDVDMLSRFLQEVKPSKSIVGFIRRNEGVLRYGKYQVLSSSYPLPVYPVYAYGNTYVVSTDVISCFLHHAPGFPYIRMEDVFVTGILGRTCNVTHVHTQEFAHQTPRAATTSDLMQGKRITYFNVSPERALKMWFFLKDYHSENRFIAKTQ